jgi:hypothetical protein
VFLLDILKEVLPNAVFITALVMIMLLLLEFVHVFSFGKWTSNLHQHPCLQIVTSAFLGLIPGCLGGFTVVSLFTHQMLSFGALVAGLISSLGDEVFVLVAYSPKITLLVSSLLLVIGIIAGIVITFFKKDNHFKGHHFALHEADHEELHDDAHHHHPSHDKLWSFRNITQYSSTKIILIVGLIFYLLLLLSGSFGHSHIMISGFHPDIETHQGISWEIILFALFGLCVLMIVAFTSNHFIKSHLWDHVIKQHFWSLFLWTFGILMGVHLLLNFIDINSFLSGNEWAVFVVLLFALLIGLIPESGPHLIFIILYFNGVIPFSILLANFIVQEGHSALPLVAESRMNFVKVKLIKLFIGATVGSLGILLQF